jgi:hypothetical protein
MRFACRDAGAARFVNAIEQGDGDARPRCGLAPCWDRDEVGEVGGIFWLAEQQRIPEDLGTGFLRWWSGWDYLIRDGVLGVEGLGIVCGFQQSRQ